MPHLLFCLLSATSAPRQGTERVFKIPNIFGQFRITLFVQVELGEVRLGCMEDDERLLFNGLSFCAFLENYLRVIPYRPPAVFGYGEVTVREILPWGAEKVKVRSAEAILDDEDNDNVFELSTAETEDLLLRPAVLVPPFPLAAATLLAIHAIGRPVSNNEPLPRDDLASIKKLLAEGPLLKRHVSSVGILTPAACFSASHNQSSWHGHKISAAYWTTKRQLGPSSTLLSVDSTCGLSLTITHHTDYSTV